MSSTLTISSPGISKCFRMFRFQYENSYSLEEIKDIINDRMENFLNDNKG